METPTSPYPNDAYKVGWISAIPIELAAARATLDEEHGFPQSRQSAQDSNSYILGRLHGLNVVIACLPKNEVGASSAALAARDLLGNFSNVRIGLMVGIGAGLPGWNSDDQGVQGEGEEEENGYENCIETDVRLGDVVIGSDKATGGVVAYNFGKKLGDGSFEVAYSLDQPPRLLRVAIAQMEAEHEHRRSRLEEYMEKMRSNLVPRMRPKWEHPGQARDILFPADYQHPTGVSTCKQCDVRRAIKRHPRFREDNAPVIHYGVITTGSEVMRHAPTRNQIRDRHGAICLDMEAAGLMNNLPAW